MFSIVVSDGPYFCAVQQTVRYGTLEAASLEEITTVFNDAFRGYFIPLQFTEQSMAGKMKGEGITKALSVGAFAGDRPVGFILHGYDEVNGVKTVYNAGTGVVPAFRGSGITASLYGYVIPLLREHGIRHHVLEVIDNNQPAIKVYQRLGFRKVRSLAAYRSTSMIAEAAAVEIRDVEPQSIDAFASIEPSWQNATASVLRDRESHRVIGAFRSGLLVGCAAYVPATGRVKQCAVHPEHRQSGIGQSLFRYMQQNSSTQLLTVTNVDESYQPAVAFFLALKFEKILRLYEMKLEV